MSWLTELIMDNNSIAHAIFLYALVIAFGVILGKIKIFGVSLGVTFVLFVGILVGHLQLTVNTEILHFIREFGLILFIFSIGLQVGPGFFSSFKRGGLILNGLAVLIILLNIAVALAIYFGFGDINISNLVGVLSGAVTNTPGLGAAQQTLTEVAGTNAATADSIKGMAMGYAAAYPLGVLGIILSMILVKAIFRINLDKEQENLAEAYLKAVASGERTKLYSWCSRNEGMDGRSAAAFVDCAMERLGDMLSGRRKDLGMSSRQLMELYALLQRCNAYLRLNVGVKHIFGLLAVDSIAGGGNRG